MRNQPDVEITIGVEAAIREEVDPFGSHIIPRRVLSPNFRAGNLRIKKLRIPLKIKPITPFEEEDGEVSEEAGEDNINL